MPTVESVCNQARAIANAKHIPWPLIAQWLDRRWRELASVTRYPTLRKTHGVTVTAPYTTGTCDVTRGSTTVSGTGTTWSHDGQWFRARTAWYKIASDTATTITLEDAFAEDTGTGLSYHIVPRYVTLDSTAERLQDFAIARLHRYLKVIDIQQMEEQFPARVVIGPPQYVAMAEADSSGNRQIEIYPYPSEEELITYTSWDAPTALTTTGNLPDYVHADVLLEGVLLDLYRRLAQEATDAQERSVLFNEARRQATTWERKKSEAVQQAQSLAQTSFKLQNRRLSPSRIYDPIVDAYSAVWYRDV